MAIGVTALATLASGTDTTAYSTGAFTPAATELLIACYHAYRTSAQPETPAITGHSMGTAWTQIDTVYYETDAGTRRQMWLFAGVSGGSPASAALTFTHTNTHLGASASVFEVTGADEANGLAQTFVQTVLGPVDAATANSISLTLAAAGAPDNRPFMFAGKSSVEDTVPRASWTEIHDVNHTAPTQSLESEWRADTFETTASSSWPTAATFCGIAWEIKNLVVAGGAGRRLTLLGVG